MKIAVNLCSKKGGKEKFRFKSSIFKMLTKGTPSLGS